jgi:antitoxin StbD
MDTLLAEASIGITELKKNPSEVIRNAGNSPVVILHHNRPTAYLVPARRYEAMMDVLDDLALSEIIKDRLQHLDEAEETSIDELERAAHAKTPTKISARRS